MTLFRHEQLHWESWSFILFVEILAKTLLIWELGTIWKGPTVSGESRWPPTQQEAHNLLCARVHVKRTELIRVYLLNRLMNHFVKIHVCFYSTTVLKQQNKRRCKTSKCTANYTVMLLLCMIHFITIGRVACITFWPIVSLCLFKIATQK